MKDDRGGDLTQEYINKIVHTARISWGSQALNYYSEPLRDITLKIMLRYYCMSENKTDVKLQHSDLTITQFSSNSDSKNKASFWNISRHKRSILSELTKQG